MKNNPTADNRYQRQTMVTQMGTIGQQRLANSHVAIIGMGGLGSPVALYLVAMGVGTITLIDHDIVSMSNLHRQVLYREHDVNQAKVLVAKKTLETLNSSVTIIAHQQKINASNINQLLSGKNTTENPVDVIVDACDNFAISYLLSDFAVDNKKPLVSASVMTTQGYVGVFCFSSYQNKPCPSIRAVFPNPPTINKDCNSVGVIGTSAAIIGSLQAQEVVKVILADAKQLAGRLLSMDIWSYRQSIIDFNHADEPSNYVALVSTQQLVDNKNHKKTNMIIDVRTHEEVSHSAHPLHKQICYNHIPMDSVCFDTLPTHKRVIFTCTSGQRALYIADKAFELGFDNVAVCL